MRSGPPAAAAQRGTSRPDVQSPGKKAKAVLKLRTKAVGRGEAGPALGQVQAPEGEGSAPLNGGGDRWKAHA